MLRTVMTGFLVMQLIGAVSADVALASKTNKVKEKMSVLFIDNENNKDLDILIKPELIEDRSVDDTARVIDRREGEWVTARIPANSTIRLDLPQKEIGEVQWVSVTGETNPLTPIGCCYNLKIGRNYFLRFTDNPFGTDCLLTEVTKNLPQTQGKRISIPYSRSKPHHADDTEYVGLNRPSQNSVSLSTPPKRE